MILFHASNIEISKPDVTHSRNKVDFGIGFYTTPYYEMAKNWCERFKMQNKDGIVSKYQLNTSIYKEYAILRFESYSEYWVDFIVACRNGKKVDEYDVIEGGVANDRVFNTIELFLSNLIDKTEVIKRLKYEKPNWQICFKKQNVIDKYLNFIGSEKL
ncbi:MAG: DUF3990 domain-containing protein [Treponema sp.]